jgi:PAS domain S-box-containing protein
MSNPPGSPRTGLEGAGLTGTRSVSSALFSRGLDMRREGVRIVTGFALLSIAGVIVLNVTLLRNAQRQIERAAWLRLEAAADVRRADVDHVLAVFRREATSIARAPSIGAIVHALRASDPEAERRRVLEPLASRTADFEFRDFALYDARGELLHEQHARSERQARADHEAVLAAGRSRSFEWVVPNAGRLAIAVPVAGGPAGSPLRIIVFHTELASTLQPLLQEWPGFGSTNGAYLVAGEGEWVRVLTTPPLPGQPQAGTRLSMNEPDGMAAAMAATGVASRLEQPGAWGDPVWSVTRPLHNARWGYVTQASRSEMMSGMNSVRQALASLDAVLLAVFLAFALVWRRSYRIGMARREMELTERHARGLQAILDTAFDAILTLDRLGRVRTANRAAQTMLDKPAEELVDQPMQRFLHWGPPGRPVSLPQAGSVVTGELARPDGTSVPVEFSIARSGEGESLVFTAIVRDVRERVEAERRIRAFADGLEQSNRRLEEMNAQLEEASRLKSEFLANTSHELRTPLNGMIGFLQLVLDGMCDSRDEEQEFLRQALQCSRHLLGLINDVLDIAKIEAGKLALDIGRIELQQVFDDVYTVTHVQAAQKGLKLEFEDLTGGREHGRGDVGKVKQILINLIGNSLKFTPKGHVRVRAKAHPELGHVMIEVEDTGIGIAAGRQKVVFDKFVQADGSTTRRFGGTGLGLAISKSLVELMGGIIGIHSDGEDQGTRVYFSVPLWRGEDAASPEPLESATDRIEGSPGDPLVLVIEDDAVFRRFLTAVLQRGGFRTVEADHAEAGWLLVRRLRPAVVVLDYALSCQEGAAMRTGWDLAQRMTTEPETRHIPVVFVTGFDGELKQRLHATAFARRPAHLVKPVEPQTLLDKISELAGSPGDRVLRVLMADDDPTVSAYVRKVLPPDKFLVDVANDGEECLHILRTQPNGYDILLLDLMMPEVSGYDVLREMTLSELHPDLPVLVLTNFPEPRNAEERRLLEEGMVLDIVSKTAVHDNPKLLPHVLDWHLQVARAEASGEPPEDTRRAA